MRDETRKYLDSYKNKMINQPNFTFITISVYIYIYPVVSAYPLFCLVVNKS